MILLSYLRGKCSMRKQSKLKIGVRKHRRIEKFWNNSTTLFL